MEPITLIKSALRLTNKIVAQRKQKTHKKTEKRKRKRSRLSLTLLLATSVIGIYLLALAASSTGSIASAHTTQTKLSPNAQSQFRSYAAAINEGKKEVTLQTSASAALSAYPNTTINPLSSANVDKVTGRTSYIQHAGQGGVLTAADVNVDCPQPLPGKLLNYISFGSFDNAVCNGIDDDLLTSVKVNAQGDMEGMLFNIPDTLTTNSDAVHSILLTVEDAAWLMLTPLIIIIGFSVMTKWGSASYADALQNVPSLVLSFIGISLCWFIAGQLVGFGNKVIEGLWYAFQNCGVTLGDVTDMVTPAGLWNEWLVYLFILLLGLIVMQALAPAVVFGTSIGAWISVGLDAVIGGLLVGDAPHFVLLGFSMTLGAEIIVRIILIDFYIILSPLVMIALGLPGQTGANFARDWIYGFLSLIASQVGQVAVLGIGMVVLAVYEANMVKLDVMVDIIKFATLALMIRVPSLFKSNAVELVKQVGPMVASGVQHEHTVFSS